MILLTGSRGLLGKELQKYISCYCPTHSEMDITKPETLKGEFEYIIHAAAYTGVAEAETQKEKCFETNVIGTINLLKAFPNTRFVYISSEYAHNPVNYYSETKRAGELAVKALAKDYLIIRTLFKERPFKYDKAFYDQYTQGDYVDVITPLIVQELIKGTRNETIYVGTGRKTMLELAMKTKPLIPACTIRDVKSVKLPHDYQ